MDQSPTHAAPGNDAVLVITSLGTALSEVDYRLPDRLGAWKRGHEIVQRRIGAAAALDYLPPTTGRVDVVLLTTRATDPLPEEGVEPCCEKCRRSAADVAEEDVRQALESHEACGATPRFHRERLDWETEESTALVDHIVGLPPRIERLLSEQWHAAFSDYAKIIVDVGSGLRPLGVGLWITATYLASARRLGERLVALYAELVDDRPAPRFDQNGGQCTCNRTPRGPAPPNRPVRIGRLFDIGPQFNSVAAIAAVTHLAEGLDFRTAETLLAKLAKLAGGQEVALPDDLQHFTAAAQLGLDIEAAAWAHGARVEATAPSLQGSEALAHALQRELHRVATQWTRPGPALEAVPRPEHGNQGASTKVAWPLDARDLLRHARVVDAFLDHGRLSDALLHAREFCVSALQHAKRDARGEPGSWLESSSRRDRGERVFGALHYYGKNAPEVLQARGATSRDVALAGQLADLVALRNKVAHAGRCKGWVTDDFEGGLRGLWQQLSPSPRTMQGVQDWLSGGWPQKLAPFALPQGPPLLVAALPLGRAAGALGNALRWANQQWGAGGYGLLLLASELALDYPEDDDLKDAHTGARQHWLRRTLVLSHFPDTPGRCELPWEPPGTGKRIMTRDGQPVSKRQRAAALTDARFILVRMATGTSPSTPTPSPCADIVRGLVDLLRARLLNARVVATSIAGATAYQTLALQTIASQIASGGAELQHWLISRAGGTPGRGEDPFDLAGVTLTIDGRGTWDLAHELLPSGGARTAMDPGGPLTHN